MERWSSCLWLRGLLMPEQMSEQVESHRKAFYRLTSRRNEQFVQGHIHG
jgi:hypothetical protein